MSSPEKKQLLKAWWPALLWLGIIVVESTDALSSANTGAILYPVLHFLTGMSLATFLTVHHYLRKLGHFVGYFTLGLLLFRAWKGTLALPQARAWSMQWARIAFFMSALVATLDEWHQTYLASRGGSVRDVLLDSSAALTAQVVIWAFLAVRSRRPAHPAAFHARN